MVSVVDKKWQSYSLTFPIFPAESKGKGLLGIFSFCLRGTVRAYVPLHILKGTLQTPVVRQDDWKKERLLHSSHAMGRWNTVRKKEGKLS